MDMNKLYDFIDSHKEDIIKDTIKLINVPSVSDNHEKVSVALDKALEIAKDLNLEAKAVINHQIGEVEMGDGSETIGILTHVDVVSAEDGEGWEFNPFKGTLSNNYICGRGAVDDKGPLIASLYAMKAIESLGEPLYKKIRLIIGTQEEVEWTDMNAYTSVAILPDYGFTPDGNFPMTNREKGYADVYVRFAKEEQNSQGFEVVSLFGGENVNSVPAKAIATLLGNTEELRQYLIKYREENKEEHFIFKEENGKLEIEAQGVSTHTAYPEKGDNAISNLCHFLDGLILTSKETQQLVSFVSKHFYHNFYGKGIGLFTKDEYVNGEFMHRTVVSPTLLRSDCGGVTITFNFRTAYGTTKENIKDAFKMLKEQYDYTFEIGDYFDPLYVDKEKPFLKRMAEAYEKISGFNNKFDIAYGTSYAKAIPNTVAWGPVFPDEFDYCHERNERIKVDRLITCTKIYATALASMALTPESFK